MEPRELLYLLIGAITAAWGFYKGIYYPARQAERDRLSKSMLAGEEDTREFRQTTETSSLNTLIGNNELMIKALLQFTDNDLKEILSELKIIRNELRETRGELQKVAGTTSLQTREWSKIEEILTDIDLMYNRIAGILEGVLIGGKDEN